MEGSYTNLEYLINDYQGRYWVKVQPETLTLTIDGRENLGAGDEYIDKPKIKVSGSRRGYGPFTRLVRFRFGTSVPTGRLPGSVCTLPWLRPEGFDVVDESTPMTYLGYPVTFIRKWDEKLQ